MSFLGIQAQEQYVGAIEANRIRVQGPHPPPLPTPPPVPVAPVIHQAPGNHLFSDIQFFAFTQVNKSTQDLEPF